MYEKNLDVAAIHYDPVSVKKVQLFTKTQVKHLNFLC